MRKSMIVLSILVALSMLLAACGQTATPTEGSSITITDTPVPAESVKATDTATPVGPTPYLPVDCQAGKTCVRWLVGLGTGTDASQIATQEEVVRDFNDAHPDLQLILEVVPFAAAKDTLSTEMASGNGPDIVGPVGWGGSN